MSKLSQVNVKGARENPEAHFRAPEDVVTDVGLTTVEKTAILEKWLDLMQQRLKATDEGMVSSAADRDIAVEERIRFSLEKLLEQTSD